MKASSKFKEEAKAGLDQKEERWYIASGDYRRREGFQPSHIELSSKFKEKAKAGLGRGPGLVHGKKTQNNQ